MTLQAPKKSFYSYILLKPQIIQLEVAHRDPFRHGDETIITSLQVQKRYRKVTLYNKTTPTNI